MADVKVIETQTSNFQNNNKSECNIDPQLFEFYKMRCDTLEKDLFKSHTQIKKLEVSIRKSREILSKNACV